MHDVDGDERRFAPSKAMVWTDNGGPILLFDQDRGSYHSLNKQASEMWRMIADGANRTQIVAALGQDQARLRTIRDGDQDRGMARLPH